MYNNIHSRGDLVANSRQRKIHSHQDHIFQSCQHIRGTVGMPGGHTPIMAGVHALQHIDSLRSPDLSYNDPVRPHPQRRTDQFPDSDFSASFGIAVTSL